MLQTTKSISGIAIALFEAFLTSAPIVGSGPGDEPAGHPIAPGHDTIAPAVGTVKAPNGVDIRYEVAGNGEPALVFVHG